MTEPRIAPLTPPYEPEAAARLAAMMPGGDEPIGLFRTFAKNLPMAGAMSGWGGYELSRKLSLSLREREIVILRTCARCGCEYEWGVHVRVFAAKAALTSDEIGTLTHGEPGGWPSARERALIRIADALHDTSDVDDALWRDASRELGEDELLDLLMLCGWYHAISFAARGARVALEPGAPLFTDFAG